MIYDVTIARSSFNFKRGDIVESVETGMPEAIGRYIIVMANAYGTEAIDIVNRKTQRIVASYRPIRRGAWHQITLNITYEKEQ